MTRRVVSWCRHCGDAGQMTDEHVPPRSTGNTEPVRRVVEPFDPSSVIQDVAGWKDGHVVRSLCEECNHRAGHWGYVAEYRRWHDLFVNHARKLARTTGKDPLRGADRFQLTLPYDVFPARLVRQVLGVFLAVQASEHLFATCPALPTLIGPGSASPRDALHEGVSISPLHIYMSVCNANMSYATQPMASVQVVLAKPDSALWTPRSSGRIDDFLMLALTPFTFVLTTQQSDRLGCDITEWTMWSRDRRPHKSDRSLDLPTVDMHESTVRGLVYPLDYAAS
jgi:hypothetical protein